VNHGFEAQVDLARADDLGDILAVLVANCTEAERRRYAGVVRLEERDLDALIFEVAFSLGEVQGGVVWSSVPAWHQSCIFVNNNNQT
jgi:hypothetical protein